ncbi:glutamate synthase-related protein [uncultured Anaerofustis sp.]|uniref:glutamate synthase-related protein n=1 Tax=uncultured Anaerofustis sp. TaxID=904996 RepID=UPI0025E7FD92|nr:glutamate synthase-related protein [uncultured Anaerofustis sp.]
MGINFIHPQFEVVRNQDRCIQCRVCERQCANEVHFYDEDSKLMLSDETNCVACHRCVSLCPTKALKIVESDHTFKPHANWTGEQIENIYRQAESGGVLLASMGNPKSYPIYFDKMLINASQVTNPSIDPLREPMETKVSLGKKNVEIKRDKNGNIIPDIPPQIKLNVPIMFSAMSYGSISYNAHESLARAASELGIMYNTGEGGLHEDFYKYGKNTIVQVASGRFGVHKDFLNIGAAIEIKMGQGAKPGIGGHLPGEKIGPDISKTRMIPEGSDAISPAPHHDIYSIEDLRQLVLSLKEATNYEKPVIVKIAAVHNVAAIASGVARSGADIIAIDGFRGGTGAAPTRIRDNVGIPIELALASVDSRLRNEGIRNNVSLVVGGSIRSSADVVKSIALGADCVYIATSALMALGCHLCRNCHSGKCNWGIATQRPDLVKRLNPDIGYKRVVNLVTAWEHEIKEMMGGMGINSIEALKGNRLMLRGVGLNEKELEILGIKHAGE